MERPPLPPKKDMAGLFNGLQFGLTVLAGLALGHWLDRRYGWNAAGTLIGFFAGAALGFYTLARSMK